VSEKTLKMGGSMKRYLDIGTKSHREKVRNGKKNEDNLQREKPHQSHIVRRTNEIGENKVKR